MRGCVMPHHRARSRSRISSTSQSDSPVIAALTPRQRQVRRGERDAQGAVGQHHHGQRCVRARGEVFGVAGEGDAGVVDHALVHRRGDHRGELAGEGAVGGALEQRAAT